VLDGQRISPEEGELLLCQGELIDLGYAAYELMLRRNPEQIITYHITRNINYTNVCLSGCRFCAFYRPPKHPEAYVLTTEEILAKTASVLEQGGRHILMQGGLHPDLDLNYFCNLFQHLKENLDVHIHALSPPEIIHLAKLSGYSIKEVLTKLMEAGLDSMPGGGAEILVHDIRQKLSPCKCGADEWLEVMACAHSLGLPTTATMMFGHVESLRDRITHLIKLRKLQDDLGGFTAFIPWTYQPGNTDLGGEPVSAVDYLRTLAVSRIMLDNFPLIQASIVTQGLKIAQLALKFGANDIGEAMLEENVVRAAGLEHKTNKDELIRLIEDLGFRPRLRRVYSCHTPRL
jgi:cyclic dehypoxanthinyl futalosine synthase